jgi:hypothetical protein
MNCAPTEEGSLMKRLLGCIVMLAVIAAPVSAEKRDLTIMPKVVSGSVPIAGEYWALIVGIDKYKEASPLETAVKDATGVHP